MKQIHAYFVAAALAVGLFCGISDARTGQGRYYYCNVYASALCFGIAAGDKASISIPVDFVLYDIRLLNKVEGSIYVGRHPESVDESLVTFEREYPANGEAGSYTYRLMRNGGHEIVYSSPDANMALTQIRLRTVEQGQTHLIGDFLRNFRPCKMESAKVKCSDERIFEQLIAERFGAP